MPYLSLLSPQSNPYEPPSADEEHETQEGPIFGPLPFVHVHRQTGIQLGADDSFQLSFVKGLVYYGGRFYGGWSVLDGPLLPEDARRLVPFDPDQAELPMPLVPCECELPGYFHCGVPGILAHLEIGRLPPDAKVERCQLCQRYADDDAAMRKLNDLGLVWQHEQHLERYMVHMYATVRVTFGELQAVSPQAAARAAEELFDWDQQRDRADFADEITEYLVDLAGDLGYSRSRRLNADFEEIAI